MGDIKSWITQSSKTALGDLLGIRECTGSGVPIFEKQSEKAIEKNNRKNTTPKKQRIVSIVFRKFSFILNRLNCNVPVKPLHVKGACTELALDAAREHRYHQAGGK